MLRRNCWVLMLVLTLAGCGLSRGGVVDIDPLSLPPRLVATPTPSPTNNVEPVRATGNVYFSSDELLVPAARTLNAEPGRAALQELLDDLSAGPDAHDRSLGFSSALPPATHLRVTALQGGVATLDLAVDQPPPDQTAAIAQIVLTATSLTGVSQVRLTFNGQPINAPLATGAQTDRLLTRADYQAMLLRQQ